jgi:hypothetical protein
MWYDVCCMQNQRQHKLQCRISSSNNDVSNSMELVYPGISDNEN